MRRTFIWFVMALLILAGCGNAVDSSQNETTKQSQGMANQNVGQTQSTPTQDTRFTDVAADAWYAEAVAYCYENGIMSGVSDTEFAPHAAMSRAMLVTAFYRLADTPETTGESGFTDVMQNAWYTNAILWATQNGIASGYRSDLFGINDPVTREQLATILCRYSGSQSANNTAPPFADATEIASYAADAVAWAKSLGVISGKRGNLFDPKGNATRAEVATILRNFLTAPAPQPVPAPAPTPAPTSEAPGIDGTIYITVTVGDAVFSAKLYDNEAARAFQALLPRSLEMSELNGNEKYHYLSDTLPTDSQRVGNINRGDLMLYGSDCLVLFYEGFSTSYSYTRLGTIEETSGLADALGRGSVEVTVSVAES